MLRNSIARAPSQDWYPTIRPIVVLYRQISIQQRQKKWPHSRGPARLVARDHQRQDTEARPVAENLETRNPSREWFIIEPDRDAQQRLHATTLPLALKSVNIENHQY
jgi:hypothetical protein